MSFAFFLSRRGAVCPIDRSAIMPPAPQITVPPTTVFKTGVACVCFTAASALMLVAAPQASAEPLCPSHTGGSPINIEATEAVHTHMLETRYRVTPLVVRLTAHGLDLPYTRGSELIVGSARYNLDKITFKTPAEHQILGTSFPMEIQLYHTAENGARAVVSVMVQEGASHPAFEEIWPLLPLEQGQTNAPDQIHINARDMLPFETAYYRYKGTTTRPPCHQNTDWFILKQPVQLSAAQIRATTALQGNTAQPLEDRGNRLILDTSK